MFEKEYSFRYSDLDSKGNIRPTAVLDILQDVSTAHSFAVGYSLEKIYSTGVAMVLKGWRIRFLEKVDFASAITVKTGIMSVSKFEGLRKYEIWQNGTCRIIATGVWFSVDFFAGRIVPISEEMKQAYGCTDEEDNGLSFVKLKDKTSGKLLGTTQVERRDIDTNNHMNNVKSVEVALEYLPEEFNISELIITYRKSLREKNSVKVFGDINSEECILTLKNQDDASCVIVKVK